MNDQALVQTIPPRANITLDIIKKQTTNPVLANLSDAEKEELARQYITLHLTTDLQAEQEDVQLFERSKNDKDFIDDIVEDTVSMEQQKGPFGYIPLAQSSRESTVTVVTAQPRQKVDIGKDVKLTSKGVDIGSHTFKVEEKKKPYIKPSPTNIPLLKKSILPQYLTSDGKVPIRPGMLKSVYPSQSYPSKILPSSQTSSYPSQTSSYPSQTSSLPSGLSSYPSRMPPSGLSSYPSQISSYPSQISSLPSSQSGHVILDLNSEVSLLEQQASELRQIISALTRNMESCRNVKDVADALKKKVGDLETLNEQLQTKIDTYDTQLGNYSQKLDIINKRIREYRNTPGKEEKVTELEKEQDTVIEEIKQLKDKISLIEDTKKKVDESKEEVKEKKAGADVFLLSLNNDQKSLKKIYTRYIGRVHKMNKKVGKMISFLEKKGDTKTKKYFKEARSKK